MVSTRVEINGAEITAGSMPTQRAKIGTIAPTPLAQMQIPRMARSITSAKAGGWPSKSQVKKKPSVPRSVPRRPPVRTSRKRTRGASPGEISPSASPRITVPTV